MSLEPETLKSLVRAAAEQVIASAPALTALDQAIGDGDPQTWCARWSAARSKWRSAGEIKTAALAPTCL